MLSILTFLVFGAGDLPDPGRALGDGALQRRRPDRRRALVIVARHVAGGIVVDQLVKQENIKPAAEAAWGIGTSLMVSIATTIIVVGVFFAAAGWLSSPTGSARGTRRVFAPALSTTCPLLRRPGLILGVYLLTASGVGLRTSSPWWCRRDGRLRPARAEQADRGGIPRGSASARSSARPANDRRRRVTDANLGERASKSDCPR